MQTTPDRSGPSLRRVLTLYFTTRQPAALLVDGLLALVAYYLLYHVWASIPSAYFQPQYGGDQNWIENFISPVRWLGSLASLIRTFAWITIGVAGLRFFVGALRQPPQAEPTAPAGGDRP